MALHALTEQVQAQHSPMAIFAQLTRSSRAGKARHSRWVSAAHSSFAPPTLHKCNIAFSVGRHLVRCPCHGQRRTGLAPLIHLSPPRGQGYGQKFGSPVPTGTPTLCWRRRRCPLPLTRKRARVDWCSAPDDRLTRRQAPQNPWDTSWGPQHTSIVLPPRGFEAQALEKMIADKSYGLIFLPNDCAHGLLEHAHAHADVRIELSDHPDARIDPRTSDTIGPTLGMSAF